MSAYHAVAYFTITMSNVKREKKAIDFVRSGTLLAGREELQDCKLSQENPLSFPVNVKLSCELHYWS